MASLPGSRTAGFIASPPAVSKPCGLPFASVVSTFPAPSGKPKLHETSPLMSIPGEELHNLLSDMGPMVVPLDSAASTLKPRMSLLGEQTCRPAHAGPARP